MIIKLKNLFHSLEPAQRGFISALSGLLVYGSWAYLVNVMHGVTAALKAACAQGGYSFTITFIMSILVESIFRQFSNNLDNLELVKWATILLTCGLVFSGSWMVHVIAGTPEILASVSLGYVFGFLFTFAYVQGLAAGVGVTAPKDRFF